MHKPKQPWGQSRDRVVVVRRSVIAALVLVRDVITQNRSCDTRLPVCVEVGVGARVSDLGGGDGGNCAAETVSYDDDLVGWVGGGGGLEGGEDAGACF